MHELGVVLVAEPDVSQQQIIADVLRSRYRVYFARNLAETIQMMITHRPSILLMEVNQPDGDGVAFIKQIRNDATSRDIVVACVTSRASVRDKVAGFQAGADDYIIKPINQDLFVYRLMLLKRLRNIS